MYIPIYTCIFEYKKSNIFITSIYVWLEMFLCTFLPPCHLNRFYDHPHLEKYDHSFPIHQKTGKRPKEQFYMGDPVFLHVNLDIKDGL